MYFSEVSLSLSVSPAAGYRPAQRHCGARDCGFYSRAHIFRVSSWGDRFKFFFATVTCDGYVFKTLTASGDSTEEWETLYQRVMPIPMHASPCAPVPLPPVRVFESHGRDGAWAALEKRVMTATRLSPSHVRLCGRHSVWFYVAGALGCCGDTQEKGINSMRRGSAFDMPLEPTALACGIGVGLDPVLISNRKCVCVCVCVCVCA